MRDEASQDGSTALMMAAERGKADVARLLLDRGAAMDVKNRVSWMPHPA